MLSQTQIAVRTAPRYGGDRYGNSGEETYRLSTASIKAEAFGADGAFSVISGANPLKADWTTLSMAPDQRQSVDFEVPRARSAFHDRFTPQMSWALPQLVHLTANPMDNYNSSPCGTPTSITVRVT
jgi:hypothetical protein